MLHRHAQDICSLLHSILQLSHGNPPQNGIMVLWEGLGFSFPPFFFFFQSSPCLNGGSMSWLICFAWAPWEPKDTANSRDSDTALSGPSCGRPPSPRAWDYWSFLPSPSLGDRWGTGQASWQKQSLSHLNFPVIELSLQNTSIFNV